MTDLKVTGLDLSLTATGLAVFQAGAVSVHLLNEGGKTGKNALRGHPRLLYLRTEICRLAFGSTHITVEGAAFDRNQGQHKMGGLWWLVMHALWMQNPDAVVVVVPPPELKRFAIGRANVGKEEIVAEMVRRYPDIPIKEGNTADATAALAMTMWKLGQPLVQVPKSYWEPALRSWPYVSIEEL